VPAGPDSGRIEVRGVDVNLSPYSMFTLIEFYQGESKKGQATKEPFAFNVTASLNSIDIVLHF
jgi:hypothetical protein